MIRKLLAIFAINWSENIYMRGESIIWFLLELIPTMYIILLWQSMQRNGSIDEKQYTFMLVYQIVTMVIARLTGSHFESWVIDNIKEGKISKSLLQPIPYPIFLFVLEAVWRLFGFLYFIPIIVMISFTWGNIFLQEIIWKNMGWFLLFMALSYIQRYLVSILIICAGCWTERAQALSHLKWILEGVLAGSWLPLTFYPLWIQKISSFTPLYYWYHIPSQIVMIKDFSNIFGFLFGSILWVIILGIFAYFAWKRSLKHYSAVGA